MRKKIVWRRKRQPTPVFLPGKSHGQRSLAGYSPRGRRVRHDLVSKQQQQMREKKKRGQRKAPSLEAASWYLLLTPAFQLWLQTCTNHLPFPRPTVSGKPCGLARCWQSLILTDLSRQQAAYPGTSPRHTQCSSWGDSGQRDSLLLARFWASCIDRLSTRMLSQPAF